MFNTSPDALIRMCIVSQKTVDMDTLNHFLYNHYGQNLLLVDIRELFFRLRVGGGEGFGWRGGGGENKEALKMTSQLKKRSEIDQSTVTSLFLIFPEQTVKLVK